MRENKVNIVQVDKSFDFSFAYMLIAASLNWISAYC